MAMVLDALASYVQNMLTEMVAEEMSMLLGVPDEMEKMKVKLGDLKNFLADADRRNITEKHVPGWVRELKGALYDASDILDLYQLKAMKHGPSRDMGCLNPLLFCLRNPLHAHDIGSRLRKLNEKINDISKRSATFNFINHTSYENKGRKMETSQLPRHETTGELELGVVGEKIEEDTRNLVELLTHEETINEQNNMIVFAIVGVGGISKTTLAKNIFNSEIIQKKFDKKMWVSINQDYSDTELLLRAIEAGGKQVTANTKDALEKTLMETVKECKTFLVMDDVWNDQAWKEVLKTPLTKASAHGSRVLVTTRDYRIARGMMAEEPYHHVNKLEPLDAWSLLKKQVVRNENDERQVEMLKVIGMGIVEKCDGLPLAVKVLGGLLCQKGISRTHWENVLNDSMWSVSQVSKELNNAIYLSYQDMDPSLKPCFLHYSLLPQKAVFNVDYIVGMWISEGFIHGGSRDLEEIGREYYNELILRNMIEPDMGYIGNMVCNMHDVVRSFAQYVARDEALAAHSVQTNIINKLMSQKFIRLSLETNGSDSNELDWRSLQRQISLRTLILIGPIKFKPDDSHITFSSIRTLHIQDTNFDALVGSLVKLKHLRYLSIKNTDISELPENIGTVKFLQHISLYGCRNLKNLPGSIEQLQQLRYLNLLGTRIYNVPKGLSGLTNLRKLAGFPSHIDGDWCSLEELGPLDMLSHLNINGLENISSTSFIRKARISEKVRLLYLSLSCTSGHEHDGSLLKGDESNKGQCQIEKVFDELSPPPCLETLMINRYFGRRLPRWMMSVAETSVESLRILVMDDLPCCTEIPDCLCQLPSLEFLQIKNAPAIKCIGPEFLQPNHLEHPNALDNLGSPVKLVVGKCSVLDRISNLPKTRLLTIIECPKLKILKGMPALQRLDLEDYNMKMLPAYLQHVNPMHLLEIDCDVSLLTSMAAGKSGPEWVKFSHVKQVKAYADDDDNNIDRKWYVLYTRDPFSFKTNISCSAILQARRERQQRLWLAYDKSCPIEKEWAAGGADMHKRQPLCQRFRCNSYRHLVPWLEQACLHCCEADKIATWSDQWTEGAEYSACIGVMLTAQQFAGTQGV